VIRLLVLLLLLATCLSPALGVLDPDCVRPIPDDLYEFKETYVPVEFDHEPFGMEVADLAMLSAVMLIGGWFSLKGKSSRGMSLLMLAGLLYFGAVRGGCICPVGATTNFCIGLAAPELIGKMVAVLFLLPLICAFFVGRIFCSSACPLGAVQHLLARKKGYALSKRFNAVVRLLPVLLLAATVWGALRGGLFIACKLDVYKLLFFTGYAWTDQLVQWLNGTLSEPRILLVGDLFAWLTLAFTLLLGVYLPRPFCRFLCPYGVLLGAASKLGLRRRRIDAATCVNCIRCEQACPVQAICSDPKRRRVIVSDFHCIQCGRCDEACSLDGIRG
jgi:polyferredoxin